jgi:GNAT superfamily N-acetyltransferase
MSRQNIISQPSIRLGKLALYGAPALAYLVQQRRVFNRMDWWSPYEWLDSDAFFALGSDTSVEAAMLVIPVSFGQVNGLVAASSQTAWLRWCAVADGVSASGVLRTLTGYGLGELARHGVTSVYAIVEATNWINSYLREAQYKPADDVVTMVCREPESPQHSARFTNGPDIRPAIRYDIDEVYSVDQSAFDEQWQYPRDILYRALETSAYYTVATQQGRVIGYQFATSDGQDAHITRLAVHPDWQNQGVGGALLKDALGYLARDMGARYVTLNTQVSNKVSQRLYSRLGFRTLLPSMQVLCRQLS